MQSVKIGCWAGFWGDSQFAASQLMAVEGLDYLISDYLAEVTMSLLVRAQAKSPDMGYAPDAIAAITPLLSQIKQRGIKVVTNAGGINPKACRAALAKVAKQAGVELSIATVTGDDVSARTDLLQAKGLKEMFSGAPAPLDFASANAYFGARPIAQALDAGADIVITGRCTDSALALGPLMHEFGWKDDDWDMLATGSLVGHLLECGAQVAGGIHTDWRDVGGWDDMGFPVAECQADGRFTITKPENTGGLVTIGTVAEQLLYEIGDPASYILPDVVCDFTQVELAEDGPDRITVTGTRGRPCTDQYKISATYQDGYRAMSMPTLIGPDSAARAQLLGESIIRRCERILRDQKMPGFDEVSIEVLGAETNYGARATTAATREVVLKIGVRHAQRAAVNVFASEIAPMGTGGPQGLTGFFAGRPRPQPVVRLFSFLAPKADILPHVELDGTAVECSVAPGTSSPEPAPNACSKPSLPSDEPMINVPLVALAWGRSGDKGDLANIGLIARKPAYLPYIRAALPASAVAGYFAHFCQGRVDCFELPGLHALNYVLHDTLGGGGMASLRIDPQGKAYAQILMDLPIPVPARLAQNDGLPTSPG
ncbi:acyclic terpene utilization AtuA family protein [Profundibacter sp.]